MTEVFPIPPAAGKGAWFLIAMLLFLLALAGLMAYLVWSTRNSRAEVGPEGLRLVGDLWGRTISREVMRLNEARVVDLTVEQALQPRRRTMGTGLGGFSAGWFRLRNNEKALIYITDRRRVAYIPTGDGYSLLVSSFEPERLLSALKRE